MKTMTILSLCLTMMMQAAIINHICEKVAKQESRYFLISLSLAAFFAAWAYSLYRFYKLRPRRNYRDITPLPESKGGYYSNVVEPARRPNRFLGND